MQLKTLLVSGFKSFLDARIDFSQGVTAVVGPNGAGKSNVVDAMLWVMGEQSTKTLRGERMEDVIFNGTETCRPLGMAEVSLVVSNVTSQELESITGVVEALPENKELMITRRLYRDGENEYSINKIPCRLKDVRGLFWEARAGAKGHTVIEQGNIDHLLSGSPQDRRAFIDETAGIVRFKRQKLEAVRKLKITQQNLDRVRDIIAEVHKQLQTLTRQVRQAKQYQTMKETCRTLEIRILKHDYDDLSGRRASIESDLAQLEVRESELMAEQTRLKASHEAHKAALLQYGEQVGHMQEELRRLEQEVGQALTTMEVERNRADLFVRQRTQASEEQTRLAADAGQAVTVMENLREQVQRSEEEIARVTERVEALETQERTLAEKRATVQTRTEQARQSVLDCAVERSHTESQQTSLGIKREELLSRIQDMQAEQDRCQRERTEAEATLAGHHTQWQQATRHIDATRTQHTALSATVVEVEERLRGLEEQRSQEHTRRVASESRWQALQAVLEEEFGYRQGREGNQSSLRTMCQGVQEVLAERVEVPQEYEVAIESVLGEHIRAWVVQGIEVIPQALACLKEQSLGRGAFVLAQPQVSSSEPSTAWWQALQKAQEANALRLLGRAVDLITVPEDLRDVWHCLLGRVVLVETLADGLAAMQHVTPPDGGEVLLVTRNGEVLDLRGIVTGGGAGEASGLLQRRREVRVLEQDVSAMDQRLAEYDRQRQIVQEQYDTHLRELSTLETSLKESETRQLVVEKETSALTSRLEALEERWNENQADRKARQEELARVGEQATLSQTRLGEIEQRQREEGRQLDELTTQLRECEEATGALYERLTDTRLALTTHRERHDRARADLDRLQDEDLSRRARLESLAEQMASLHTQTLKSQEEHQRAESVLRDLESRKAELERQRTTAEAQRAEGLQQSREDERRLNENHQHCASARDRRGTLDIQLAEIRTRIQTIEETIRGTYGESPESVERLLSPPVIPASAGIQAAKGDAGTAGNPPVIPASAGIQAAKGDAGTAGNPPVIPASAGIQAAKGDAGAPGNPPVIPANAGIQAQKHQGEDANAWRETLKTLRARMERMGPLNLAAIDEHRELEERYQFLGRQAEDLTESIQSLQKIIERLNRTTNRLFRETFEALQKKFREVFAALFAGGKAELVLVKPDLEQDEDDEADDEERDLAVDYGVDIVAQPPGKRLKNLTMLSGGEKALTVLALMFSSFLVKPSPFCILDEVDAPLDESNVTRFARFLTQLTSLSQFLVITHNKCTMEVAETLLGVTMEQPGVSKFVSVRIADLENVS